MKIQWKEALTLGLLGSSTAHDLSDLGTKNRTSELAHKTEIFENKTESLARKMQNLGTHAKINELEQNFRNSMQAFTNKYGMSDPSHDNQQEAGAINSTDLDGSPRPPINQASQKNGSIELAQDRNNHLHLPRDFVGVSDPEIINDIINSYLKEIPRLLYQIPGSSRSDSFNIFMKILEEMEFVRNSLREGEHHDKKLLATSRTQFNRLARLFDDVKKSYVNLEKNLENSHLVRTRLGNLEEFIQVHRERKTLAPPKRKIKYNSTNQLINELEQGIEKLKAKKLTEAPLLYTEPLKRELIKMKKITIRLNRHLLAGTISEKSRKHLKRVARTFDEAKIIYENMQETLDRNLSKKQVPKIRANLNQIEVQLEKIEEVIAFYRGDKITAKYSNHTYYPNFEKRFEEFLTELKQTDTAFKEIENRVFIEREEVGISNLCTQGIATEGCKFDKARTDDQRHDNFTSLKYELYALEDRIKDIKSELIKEKEGIKYFLTHKKITPQQEAEKYVHKYDEKIHILENYVEKLDLPKEMCKEMTAKLSNSHWREEKIENLRKLKEVLPEVLDKHLNCNRKLYINVFEDAEVTRDCPGKTPMIIKVKAR